MINIGKYIETAINWLTNHFATFFDTLSIGIGGFIDSFQHVLYGIPFYITIIALTVLAWIKSGKGTAVFTILGLLLIYGMGFWEETMQTLALVLSSTCLALLLGVPLGIWTANSNRCNKIMRPILDFMQTMPAFCIPDSGGTILWFGYRTGRICNRYLRYAACSAANRARHPPSSEKRGRSFPLFRCHSLAVTLQGTATPGAAHYNDRNKPDYHDVSVHGGDCRYDFRRRLGRNCIERNYPNENRTWI